MEYSSDWGFILDIKELSRGVFDAISMSAYTYANFMMGVSSFVLPSLWGLKRDFEFFYHISLTTYIILDCTKVFGPLS